VVRARILDAEHVLTSEDATALRAAGCRIVRPLGGTKYLVDVDARWSTADRAALPVRSVSAIVPERKLDPAAKRAVTGDDANVFARLLFRDDVDLETAKAIVASVGGAAMDGERWGSFRSLAVRIPRDAIERLAARDEILGVVGPRPPIVVENATAAAVSSVTPLYDTPYDLSGSGVVVTMWDDGSVYKTHSEFTGRVFTEDGTAVAQHPTHVAGTIAAAGLNSDAKGMAPQVVVHQFDFKVGDWWTRKDQGFTEFTPSADNNSWGYGGGWSNADNRRYWEWWGDELFGAYAFESAQIDKLTRDHGTLVVFSAGNEDTDSGPTEAPWPHYHGNGTTVYCASSDGTGTDCPVATCAQCELTRHPPDGPYDTINIASSSKDSVTVGAVNASKKIGSFSSRGPVVDGRVKPDVVADGVNVLSTLPGNTYGRGTGTSMSTPVVTGVAALIVEQWRRTMGATDPSPATIKALLTGTAEDLGEHGPDYTFGFGLVNAKAAVDAIIADGGSGSRIATGAVKQGWSYTIPFDLAPGGNAKLTLVWSDPELPLVGLDLSSHPLVNDLDLAVEGPEGTIRPFVLDPNTPDAPATKGVNRVDTVEQVEVTDAIGGSYVAVVRGASIPQAPQEWTVVSTTDMGTAVKRCEDPYEPNDSTGSAWGMLKNGIRVRPDLCDQGDVDYFEFVVDRSGPVSVEIAASDSPVKATLVRGGETLESRDVAAGSKTVIATTVGSGSGQEVTPVTFYVRIEPAGTLVTNGYYSVDATYPSDALPRRRGARRP